ncbi:hypothetical protein [Ligilactobacillus equi]|uniref:DUF551 domain-containing protein n=1 Tax=Ligilactobacillus equi DPC 6820 TaxID=1392007 RepID=V7HWU7_9LACO|nr:hypothetical protein [Ligilactobacillus equi]ETA73755.1 hypothetical protein LEQ_0058c [Ligilactobacillus equi DPC 6820]
MVEWKKIKLKEISKDGRSIWDGEVPQDKEEVLVTNGDIVDTDVWIDDNDYSGLEYYSDWNQANWDQLPLSPKSDTSSDASGWIKFQTRPTTQEEKDSGLDYPSIYVCDLPDVGDDILISDGYVVKKDLWADFEDGTVGLYYANVDYQELWWMPMPKAPKKEG